MDTLLQKIDSAARQGQLLPSSLANIQATLAASVSPVTRSAIEELVASENWSELDNRFFRTLAFGTGGLRSKTIGAVITTAEQGSGGPNGRPEFPCVGTHAMNDSTIRRTTRGLVAYVLDWHSAENRDGKPGICIAHDTRHFSRQFAELAAQVISDLGCNAFLFEAERSTPELSFAVRFTGSTAGINLTASHNPPEYNGYKVYFEDGGQIVQPHASGIITRVNAIQDDTYAALVKERRGQIIPMGADVDSAYLHRLESLILDPEVVRNQPLKIVYSSLHGVGGAIIRPLLDRLGVQFSVVASQEVPDGRFPTVKSPNPENAEALTLAMAQAETEGADLVLATDPDDDRMGAAARGRDGKLHLLSGNQLGSLMAWYRAKMHFELGILDGSNRDRGVIIKTFVTTGLQDAIAAHFGLRCVDTLTGFKYIGAKLTKYEQAIPRELRENYARLSETETRSLRLAHSSLFVFGGEESYGYSGADFVRDKDGNSAVAMITEVAAYAKSQGLTLLDLLDELYCQFGFFNERGESLVMEGASGAAQIQKLVESYAATPPTKIGARRVIATRNFAAEKITDVEGDTIPVESMLSFELETGLRVAIRPSGTEPKIKYYLFAHREITPETPSQEGLAEIKEAAAKALEDLWVALQADARMRCEQT
jgi:phosphoglucomutase